MELGLKWLEEEIIVAAIDVCPRVLARRRSDRSKRTIDASSCSWILPCLGPGGELPSGLTLSVPRSGTTTVPK